jgi:hypothetical protein
MPHFVKPQFQLRTSRANSAQQSRESRSLAAHRYLLPEKGGQNSFQKIVEVLQPFRKLGSRILPAEPAEIDNAAWPWAILWLSDRMTPLPILIQNF